MSILYVCLTCNTEEEAINAVYSIAANDYVGVKNCPDCNKEREVIKKLHCHATDCDKTTDETFYHCDEHGGEDGEAN